MILRQKKRHAQSIFAILYVCLYSLMYRKRMKTLYVISFITLSLEPMMSTEKFT